MIILTATMWPRGVAAASYELLHASISNQDDGNYLAHVLSRPNSYIGVTGFEADVQVHNHKHHTGPVPLLIATLATAYDDKILYRGPGEQVVPAGRLLARAELRNAAQFEEALRGRQ